MVVLVPAHPVYQGAYFDRGMRAYMQIPGGQPGGHEAFTAAMSKAAGRDMSSFIMPWLQGKYIPDVDARAEGTCVIVSQTQPEVVFDLPLKLALTTVAGKTVERTIQLKHREDTLDVRGLGEMREVRVDPDHQFLMRRHWGETVRFELRAPNAKEVMLAGLMSLKPLPATRNGDVWTLAIPLTEGRYPWNWQVDGKPVETDYEGQPGTGLKMVKALQRVSDAYPK